MISNYNHDTAPTGTATTTPEATAAIDPDAVAGELPPVTTGPEIPPPALAPAPHNIGPIIPPPADPSASNGYQADVELELSDVAPKQGKTKPVATKKSSAKAGTAKNGKNIPAPPISAQGPTRRSTRQAQVTIPT